MMVWVIAVANILVLKQMEQMLLLNIIFHNKASIVSVVDEIYQIVCCKPFLQKKCLQTWGFKVCLLYICIDKYVR